MKNRPFRLAAALVWLLFAVARPVFSQNISSPGEPPVTLPSFSASPEKTDRYRTTNATSVARIDDSILDTPMSVNVVPRELMEDLGAGSLYDATRYFGGVSDGRTGIMDRLNFRGFESYGKNIDHFPALLLPTGNGPQANFDPVFVERAELVMGPDTILSPADNQGGSINVITKSPQFQSANEISGQVGNYNGQKITLDSTGPISQHLAYRVIGSVQDTRTYEPGKLRQTNGSVQLAYRFSDTSRLTFKWFGEDWKLTGAVANPGNNGEMVYTPDTILGATLSNQSQPGFRYDGWNGSARWSHRTDRLNIIELEYTGVINDLVSVRLAAQGMYDKSTQDVAVPLTSGGTSILSSDGLVVSVSNRVNPASVPEEAFWNHATNYDEQLQNDYAANFHPGGISLRPMVGWAYQQGSEPTNISRTDRNMPATNLFATDDYAPPHPLPSSYTSGSFQQTEHAWLVQAHGLVKAGFYDDRIKLTSGAARTWAEPRVYTNITGFSFAPLTGDPAMAVNSFAYPGGAYLDSAGKDSFRQAQRSFQDTYLGGVLLKPAKGVSLYYSFSSNAGIVGGEPVLWTKGKQHEFGVKTEFFDHRLSVTAAHFQISESSSQAFTETGSGIIRLTPASPNYINHGFELNLVGGLTNNLSIVASFTEMKLRDIYGRRQRNVPDQLANLLLNYHFTEGTLRGFDVFAGVLHKGNVAGESPLQIGFFSSPRLTAQVAQPGFYLAPWTVVNAGAGYVWERYRFNLNVDNVLNSKFWWQPLLRQSVSPYPGITVRFTTSVHF